MSKISEITIGELIEFQRGFDLPKSSFVEGDIPVISSNGILGFHNEYKVEGPGITIGRSGTVGLPHYIETNFFPHNTSLFVKDFKGNYPLYIYYLLKTLNLNEMGSGSGVPTMNRNHLHPLKVKAYKDTSYQEYVVKILSSLDSKIALNNRINTELEAMAKTIYDYWFVQFDFPVPSTSSGTGNKPYKSSGGKMVWNEELKREVPEGWRKGTLSDLGDIVGGSTPPREIPEYFTNEGTAWITPKDLSLNSGNKYISKGELDVSDKGLKSASLNIMPQGTILLSSRAPIGYLAISREKVTTNQGFKSFVPNKGYSTEYVYYSVKNMIPAIENNAVGSTFKEVSATTLKSILICLADEAVVNKYTERVKPIFNRQNLLEQENLHLTSLRDWLLPMLMNGQVKVDAGYMGEVEISMAAEPGNE
jgi:type I restriction enzyme S subunit